jgi:hypothetical protein
LLAAARRNTKFFTGPRSAAAKQNSKLYSMKHGRHALSENPRLACLRGMVRRDDPEEFQGREQVPVSAAKL